MRGLCDIMPGMRFDAAFILFFLSLGSVALLHAVALNAYLYWLYPWFDIPMHFLGGTVAGFGFLSWVGERLVPIRSRALLATLLFVALIGIGWEVFEWYFDLVDTLEYVPDTIGDLFFDLMGGIVAYGLVFSFKRIGV
jgi:hypothetical protein